MKLKHIIILQNKIDLVKESQAKEQYDQILKFVQGETVCQYLQVYTHLVLWFLVIITKNFNLQLLA